MISFTIGETTIECNDAEYAIKILADQIASLEERLTKLEPKQQELDLWFGCNCVQPWLAMGNPNCLRCGKANRVKE
jgi:hypothetical protein